MAQLLQDYYEEEYQSAYMSEGFAAVISRQKLRLVSNLSGGRGSYESLANPALPLSMIEPVSFDDSTTDEDLNEVRMIPVDESEDDW